MSEGQKFPEGRPKTTDTVRIPSGILRAVEEFLETETARKMGYRFKTDVVTAAVRSFLKEHEYYLETPRFEHHNTYEDHITIRDRRSDRFIDVYLKPALGFIIYCENEEANFVWWILDCDVETFERNIDDFFDYVVHQGAFESRLKMVSEDRTLESGGQYLFVLCQTNQFLGDIPVEVHVSIKEWQY